VSQANLRYARKMRDKSDVVVETQRRLSGEYPRFGSRRIRILLGREGIVVSKERCSRLLAQSGLQILRKRRRRRNVGLAPQLGGPNGPLLLA